MNLPTQLAPTTAAASSCRSCDPQTLPVHGREVVEVAEDIGLPVEENRELADELRALGVSVGQDVIPSIRSIEEIE
jgi:hypothetical protein